MGTSNIISGIDAERASQLRGTNREQLWDFNMGVDIERRQYVLGLTREITHADIQKGGFVSVGADGKVVPLDPSLEFAGVVESVGQDNLGRYSASTITRAAIVVKIAGLTRAAIGSKVHAQPGGSRPVFSLDQQGVVIGEVIAIEKLETERAIVGIRVPGDTTKFELGGNRP